MTKEANDFGHPLKPTSSTIEVSFNGWQGTGHLLGRAGQAGRGNGEEYGITEAGEQFGVWVRGGGRKTLPSWLPVGLVWVCTQFMIKELD